MIQNSDIQAEVQSIFSLLEEVKDPEIPVLSVIDLGIVRDVIITNEDIVIHITPTYIGCPAMGVIEMDMLSLLWSIGYKNVKIETVISPAWTTDWMTESGKQKLKEYGIAAPSKNSKLVRNIFELEENIVCPRCNSEHTLKISEFGSTACKALYQCQECKEPFDYFKCH